MHYSYLLGILNIDFLILLSIRLTKPMTSVRTRSHQLCGCTVVLIALCRLLGILNLQTILSPSIYVYSDHDTIIFFLILTPKSSLERKASWVLIQASLCSASRRNTYGRNTLTMALAMRGLASYIIIMV